MTISDFARSRGVEPQAVSRYIGRHEEIAAHVQKKGKVVELGPEAERLLDEVYPLPQPVHIVQGVPHEEHETLLREAKGLYAKIAELQGQLMESRDLLAKAEAKELLLEDRERQLTDEKAAREAAERREAEAREAVAERDREIARLHSRTLWQRIRDL